ncbi:MAG: effector-associated domain EAD1-containing protein, partial [Pyrinomonadaceae bacterium]
MNRMIKLSPNQYKRLRDALVAAFTLSALNEMLLFEVGKDLEQEASGADLNETVLNLIKKAQQVGWLPDLVAGAVKANATDELRAIQDELKPAIKAQNVNHFNVCFVDNDLALVNRTVLREHLGQLAGSAAIGGRILVVNGPPFSGKTYSKELIGYLRRALESFRLVFIDLLTIQGEVKPLDVASSIVQQLGLNDGVLPPHNQEQDSRWVEAFCNRLTGQLGDKNDPWWVVIDGFTHITLSPSVDDLIK